MINLNELYSIIQTFSHDGFIRNLHFHAAHYYAGNRIKIVALDDLSPGVFTIMTESDWMIINTPTGEIEVLTINNNSIIIRFICDCNLNISKITM